MFAYSSDRYDSIVVISTEHRIYPHASVIRDSSEVNFLFRDFDLSIYDKWASAFEMYHLSDIF